MNYQKQFRKNVQTFDSMEGSEVTDEGEVRARFRGHKGDHEPKNRE